MSLAIFSDRYAGGNAGTAVTIAAAGTGYMPNTFGLSASGTPANLRVPFQIKMTAAAAGPTANDLLVLGPLLLGYTLTGIWFDFPNADSSTGMTYELGDWTTAGKYIATGAKLGQAQDFVSSFTGGAFTAGAEGDASIAFVAASLPNFYSAYNATGQRSQPGATSSADFVNGIANDLILKCTHAATTYVVSLTVNGFYDLTLNPYPYGTADTNY